MNRRVARARFLRIAGALAVPGSVAFGGMASAADTYTLRMSMVSPKDSVVGATALRLAVAVERRSNGQLKIEVYPSGQIATEPGSVDNLTTGVLDLAIVPSQFLIGLASLFQAFDAPFVFKDIPSVERIFNGPLGAEFFAALEPKGIVGLCWGSNGLKEFETTSKAITVPDDLKGLRFRIVNSALNVATYQALGAIPVPMDVNETYAALSQRLLDGLDVNLDAFAARKMYTIVKHVAMSNHSISVVPLLGSKRKIDALPAPLQKILRDEAKAVAPFWVSATAHELTNDIDILKKNGVAFSEIQFPAFRKAMEPVYATIQSRLGGNLLERVMRTAS